MKNRLHDRWFQSQTAASFSRPAIVGDVVYFGTGDGNIVARSRATGEPHWTAAVGGALLGARLVARNGVIVGSTVTTTVAVRASDGARLWSYSAPNDTVGGGTQPGQVLGNRLDADDEMVFIPAWGASVSAVDLNTGAVRWIWRPGRSATDTEASGVFRSGASGVRVSGDTIYATVWHFLRRMGVPSEGWIVALDRASGRELWRVTVPCYWSGACIDGAPAVYGRLVIVNTGAHEYAIDRWTQHVAWDIESKPVNTSVSQSELFGDVVYHDGGDHQIYAVRAVDGTLLWKAPIPGTATRDLLVTDRRIILPDGMFVYVLDRATGARIVEAQTRNGLESPVSSPAIAADGRVFVNLFGAAWSFDEP